MLLHAAIVCFQQGYVFGAHASEFVFKLFSIPVYVCTVQSYMFISFAIFHQIASDILSFSLLRPHPPSSCPPHHSSFLIVLTLHILSFGSFSRYVGIPVLFVPRGINFLLVLTWRHFSARSHEAPISASLCCCQIGLSAAFSAAERAAVARGHNVHCRGDNRAPRARIMAVGA